MCGDTEKNYLQSSLKDLEQSILGELGLHGLAIADLARSGDERAARVVSLFQQSRKDRSQETLTQLNNALRELLAAENNQAPAI